MIVRIGFGLSFLVLGFQVTCFGELSSQRLAQIEKELEAGLDLRELAENKALYLNDVAQELYRKYSIHSQGDRSQVFHLIEDVAFEKQLPSTAAQEHDSESEEEVYEIVEDIEPEISVPADSLVTDVLENETGTCPAPDIQQVGKSSFENRVKASVLKGRLAKRRLSSFEKLLVSTPGSKSNQYRYHAGDIAELFERGCDHSVQKFKEECSASENPCEPKKQKIPGLHSIHSAIQRFIGKRGGQSAATRMDRCLLNRFLEESGTRLAKIDFARMAPGEFRNLRKFYLNLLSILSAPGNRDLLHLYGHRIEDQFAAFDPYGPLGDPARILEQFCKRVYWAGKDQAKKNLDVRDVLMLEDLVLDPAVQKGVNTLLYSRSFQDDVQARAFIGKGSCLEEMDSGGDYDGYMMLLEKLSFTGSRTKHFKNTDRRLESKLNQIVHAKGGQIRPEFTPEEAWLLDHQLEGRPLIDAIVLAPALRLPTATQVKARLEARSKTQKEASVELRKVSFRNFRPGDFLLESQMGKLNYKGKNPELDIRLQRALTGTDVAHAGIMLKLANGNTQLPGILHVMDSDTISGTQLGELRIGEESFMSGYRFNFPKLMTPAFRAYLKEKGLQPNEIVNGLAKFDTAYLEKAETEFEPQDGTPKYSIKNQKGVRILSAIPRAFQKFIKPYVKSRAGVREAAEAYEIEAERRALEKQTQKLSLSEKIKARRRLAKTQEEKQGSHEICSEFAFAEGFRYVEFLNKNLRKDMKLPAGVSPFEIPNIKVRFNKLHPGAFQKKLRELERKGFVIPVSPTEGLFAKSR